MRTSSSAEPDPVRPIWRRRSVLEVALGVLSAVIVGITFWWALQPAARLPRLLLRVPPPVQAVSLPGEGASSDPLSLVVSRVFPDGMSVLPRGVRPRAILFVAADGARRPAALVPVALAFPRDADAVGAAPGVRWHGMFLYGDARVIARLTSVPLPPVDIAAGGVARSVRTHRHERAQQTLLVRHELMRALYPALDDLPVPGWTALSWSGDPQGLTIHAVVGGVEGAVFRRAGRQLGAEPPGTALAIDGLPANLLTPPELPPVLAALRTSSGVSDEITTLQQFLGDRPIAFIVVQRDAQLLPVLVAPIAERERAEAHRVLAALFAARLAHLHAPVERLRDEHGRLIQHRVPANGAAFLVSSDRGDEVVQLIAPCGAAARLTHAQRDACVQISAVRPEDAARAELPQSLVARIGDGILVAGVSEAAVDAVTRARAHAPESGSPPVALTVDGERLRSHPVLSVLARQLSVNAREWASILMTIRGTVTPAARDVAVDLVLSFAPQPPGP